MIVFRKIQALLGPNMRWQSSGVQVAGLIPPATRSSPFWSALSVRKRAARERFESTQPAAAAQRTHLGAAEWFLNVVVGADLRGVPVWKTGWAQSLNSSHRKAKRAITARIYINVLLKCFARCLPPGREECWLRHNQH